MKFKNTKFTKRIIALMLAVIIVCTNIDYLDVLAATINPTNKVDSVTQGQGNANPGSASGNGTGASYDFNVKEMADTSDYINSRAYLITMIKVENNSCVPHKI